MRIVPGTFIENIFARPKDVLTGHPTLDVDCFLQHLEASHEPLTLEVELRDGERVVAKGTQKVPPSEAATEPMAHTVHLDNLVAIKLWDLTHPNLYSVHVRLLRGTQLVDQDKRTLGFREAQSPDHGFELNGKVINLRALARHQTFPFARHPTPARPHPSDARILPH